MPYKKILMAVEHDFNVTHVGVLRVIRYHFNDLVARGHSVTLATFKDGEWISCSMLDAARAILGETRQAETQRPYWQSGNWAVTGVADVLRHDVPWSIKWDGPVVTPEAFDESILTNPWLCSQYGEVIPDSPFSTGIVYDMVPNLIALGMLRLPQFIDIYRFANEHHVGYDYFMRNLKTVSCISESTRHDFNMLYSVKSGPQVNVCIPFGDFGSGVVHDDPAAQDVLMINVLDHRKNFLTVAKSLKEASATVKLHVVIVGRERLPREEVMHFLTDIAQVCASVRWYRSPADTQVQALMAKAKVVFFPSVYEGLGLPILEAQALGVPVISSNNSSCGEINMNRVLTADPYDHKAYAAILVELLEGRMSIMTGDPLRKAQIAFLHGKNKLFSSTVQGVATASELYA
jgi:glycosyltransferase involved in cell wall biosynthesis